MTMQSLIAQFRKLLLMKHTISQTKPQRIFADVKNVKMFGVFLGAIRQKLVCLAKNLNCFKKLSELSKVKIN